jgi:arsenite methyltransferase
MRALRCSSVRGSDLGNVAKDRWATWLAERRYGGDAEVKQWVTAELVARRDRILDDARVLNGDLLLDVGCGEGLVAFGALERGASVVFSDISNDLLEHCRQAADDLGVAERSRFVQTSADDLSPIDNESVDVVTTRSVLIYVGDKRRAFAEFFRVLRPEGRISLYEPINRFGLGSRDYGGFDLSPVGDLGEKLLAIYEAIQPPDSDPMLDFDERDLFRLCEESGFYPISMTLEAELRPLQPRSWESFLHASGNPKIPTLAEAMNEAFTPAERERLVAHLRPLVERGDGSRRLAHCYLSAVKPA